MAEIFVENVLVVERIFGETFFVKIVLALDVKDWNPVRLALSVEAIDLIIL